MPYKLLTFFGVLGQVHQFDRYLKSMQTIDQINGLIDTLPADDDSETGSKACEISLDIQKCGHCPDSCKLDVVLNDKLNQYKADLLSHYRKNLKPILKKYTTEDRRFEGKQWKEFWKSGILEVSPNSARGQFMLLELCFNKQHDVAQDEWDLVRDIKKLVKTHLAGRIDKMIEQALQDDHISLFFHFLTISLS